MGYKLKTFSIIKLFGSAPQQHFLSYNPRNTPIKKAPSGRFRNLVAGVTGLEPATSGLTGQRSNQLSYTPVGTGAAKPQRKQIIPTLSTVV